MTEVAPIAASIEQLVDFVAHYQGTITGLLTPEMAAVLKTFNIDSNRPEMEANSQRFEKIAKAGGWQNTGEPLVFSSEGRLIDGQHRLEGIIRSGCSVVVDIRFGAHPEAFHAMGTGARRTAAHALAILGEAYSTTQAGIAKLVYLHDRKLLTQFRGGVETPEIVRVVRENPTIGAVGKAIQSSKFHPIRSSGVGFSLVLAARVAPMERIMDFIDLASSGLADDPKRPARMLHQRLLDALSRKERLDQMEIAAITARSWNAYIEGRDVKHLKVLRTDRSGEFFPKVLGPSP